MWRLQMPEGSVVPRMWFPFAISLQRGLTPELSRPAREAGRSLEATKRVRLE
jgi:hypothetical protein